MPLSFTSLLRLKRCHACDQWHSSREYTALTIAIINYAETLKAIKNFTVDEQRLKMAQQQLIRKLQNNQLKVANLARGYVQSFFLRRKFTLEDAIELHAFAPLEALAGVWPMAFLSDVHSS
jgi:hypothetical protein